ncbi:hypothetical protein [Bacillus sp. m3-13]|uniref:hypothetical protein n=1 Tax=Bacillus sp. m3-13 TaxID=406124 RepID=UPI0001E89CAC|nr:hypothetical protein [Bacillus sp. m3-13]
MKFLETISFMLSVFLLFNFLFSLVYILSKSAGKGFYRWITLGMDFLAIMVFPFFGLTQLVASSTYERFNWFVARMLLILYAIVIFSLMIAFFIGFTYFVGKR